MIFKIADDIKTLSVTTNVDSSDAFCSIVFHTGELEMQDECLSKESARVLWKKFIDRGGVACG
jgi:hypothetical protein